MVDTPQWKKDFAKQIFEQTGCQGYIQFFACEKAATATSIDLYITLAVTPIEVRVYNPQTLEYICCVKPVDELNFIGSTNFEIPSFQTEADVEYALVVISRQYFACRFENDQDSTGLFTSQNNVTWEGPCVQPDASTLSCIVCGAEVKTCERSEPDTSKGYSDYTCPVHDGSELENGTWVCSNKCWKEATEEIDK